MDVDLQAAYKDKDSFIDLQEFVVGYSKAPEQPQSSARPICHSHTMMNTGHEPATIRIDAYRSLLLYALRHSRRYVSNSTVVSCSNCYLLYYICCITMMICSHFTYLSPLSAAQSCPEVTLAGIENADDVYVSEGDGTSYDSKVSAVFPSVYFQCLRTKNVS